MLKRSLKYLVISLMIFLSFNSKVYADGIPELTCKYYNKKVNWMISQDKDGNGYLYKNSKGGADITESASGWKKITPIKNLRWGDNYKTSIPKLSDSNPKYLEDCPVAFIKKGTKYYVFSSKTSKGYDKLNGKNDNKVIEYQGGVGNYITPSIGKGISASTVDSDNSGNVPIDIEVNFIDTREEEFDCDDIFGEDGEIITLLRTMLNVIKIIVPVLVIVLGSLDFVNAIFSQDDGNMKKAQTKFIKRLIIAVAIFLAPAVLKFLLTIANQIWPIIDASLCGIID